MNRDEPQIVIATLHLEIPSAYTYLQIIGVCISSLLQNELSLPEKETVSYNVELAVHEACTNIIEHAYAGLPGRIKMIFTLVENPKKFIVELFDNGRPFDFPSIQKPVLDEPQIRGYGLFLMQELMDQVEYTPGVEGNSWKMIKKL